jgi:ATP-dependent Clp protease protease subunit
MTEIMALHTGQTEERVRLDTERDKYMSADEAKEYGLVDQVLDPPRLVKLREMRANEARAAAD